MGGAKGRKGRRVGDREGGREGGRRKKNRNGTNRKEYKPCVSQVEVLNTSALAVKTLLVLHHSRPFFTLPSRTLNAVAYEIFCKLLCHTLVFAFWPPTCLTLLYFLSSNCAYVTSHFNTISPSISGTLLYLFLISAKNTVGAT